ncbi:MAG: hypothetical protein C0506_05390 [Anaerolinea sp.]|nr:hypothetical protein [Anaerolinea sp.]
MRQAPSSARWPAPATSPSGSTATARRAAVCENSKPKRARRRVACPRRGARVACALMPIFDPTRPSYIADPYPALAALRRTEPVHRSVDMGAWIVTSYEEAQRILRDEEHFSSDPVNAGGDLGAAIAARREAVPMGTATILGNSDDPVHAHLRGTVNRAFTPRTIASRKVSIEGRIAGLLDQAPPGQVEIMSALAEPLAASTILAHLGIPDDEQATFRQLSLDIMRARSEGPGDLAVVEAAEDAIDGLMDMLQEWDESGRCDPASVVGTLFAAAHAGEDLEPEDLLMLLIHISTAGNGPTAMAIGNIAYHLATNPERLDELLAARSLIPDAVEELLRFDSPTHLVARFAVRDSTAAGRKIRVGDQVFVCVGGANRDPAEFPNPDTLDFHRGENRHLSFGLGGHFCLGAPLARLEFQSVIAALLDRYGAFELKAFERGGNFLVRGAQRVVIG